MRRSAGQKRIACVVFLLTSVFFSGGAAAIAGAQADKTTPKPVKVSPADADKLITYRSNDNRVTARAIHLQGSVTLEYTVTTGGTTTDIIPIAGDKQNATLVHFATTEVSHWRYEPYVVNGKPTPMRTTTVIKYP